MGRGQKPYGGCIWALEAQYIPNTPSGWPLTSPHMGGVPFSLIPCAPLGAPGIHRLGPLWPKMVKNHPKRGYPLFWPLFQEGSRNPDPIFADFRKKVRTPPPPKDGPAGGIRTFFFENRQKWGLDFCYLPEKVAKGGGGVPPFWAILGYLGPKWPQTVDPWGTQWGARY